MQFTLDETFSAVAKIKVIGVGGAGGNAVNRMVESGLQGVEFIAINTDAMALDHNKADVRIQIGDKVTAGLGAGANPQVGAMALQEDRDRIRECLEGADMVFIAAGMGGGTGTGAAPVVAEIAHELGILTVGVVTKPFLFEGPVRERNSKYGLENMRKHVDTIIIIPNQKILSIIEKNTPFREAFKKADEVLTSATKGISDIILKHGDIQVDFADVRTIMSQGGDALMGTAFAKGDNRATLAADRAIHSPLLDNVSIAGATGVLINITGGDDLTMMEVNDAMNFIYEAIGPDSNANIIFGTVINPELKDEITITVIATGFGQESQKIPLEIPFKPTAEAVVERISAPLSRPSQPQINVSQAHAENYNVNNNNVNSAPQHPSSSGQTNVAANSAMYQSKRVVTPENFVKSGHNSSASAKNQERAAQIVEEVIIPPATRIPMGNSSPGGFNKQGAAREDETHVIFSEKHDRSKGQASGSHASGRFVDYDPDIDYDTPAFLRNQAD